jgi:hypothetical protein
MSSMVLDGVAPRSRSTDPVTSVDAGRSVNLRESHRLVMSAFVHPAAARGLIQEQVTHATAGIVSPSRARSAVSELVELGLLEWTGETRATMSGRQARIYRAT